MGPEPGPEARPELGPEVDTWPRPLPARTQLAGTHVTLEPLHRRHVAELFEAARSAPESFAYVNCGPFATREDMAGFIANEAARHDPLMWAARPVVSGLASGWLGLLNINPSHAAIEMGGIWFAPKMQRTRAATEAMFLLMSRAMDELGYRRLSWKCHAHNKAAMNAAKRLGFTFEGILRAETISKGHQRDNAVFSLIADEWPLCRAALSAWLAPPNFHPDGTAKQSVATLRGAQ